MFQEMFTHPTHRNVHFPFVYRYILKFGIQDFTDPGLLKIRLTLTGLSLSVFKNQGAFAITTTKATKTLLKT